MVSAIHDTKREPREKRPTSQLRDFFPSPRSFVTPLHRESRHQRTRRGSARLDWLPSRHRQVTILDRPHTSQISRQLETTKSLCQIPPVPFDSFLRSHLQPGQEKTQRHNTNIRHERCLRSSVGQVRTVIIHGTVQAPLGLDADGTRRNAADGDATRGHKMEPPRPRSRIAPLGRLQDCNLQSARLLGRRQIITKLPLIVFAPRQHDLSHPNLSHDPASLVQITPIITSATTIYTPNIA